MLSECSPKWIKWVYEHYSVLCVSHMYGANEALTMQQSYPLQGKLTPSPLPPPSVCVHVCAFMCVYVHECACVFLF